MPSNSDSEHVELVFRELGIYHELCIQGEGELIQGGPRPHTRVPGD